MEEKSAIDQELPQIVNLSDYMDHPPELPPELIEGVLRCGHKLLLSGPSKAGKSFLLMELCVAIAEGKRWLGFQCRKGRVLYINLEIDEKSCIIRFRKIYRELNSKPQHMDDICIWNLRGHAATLKDLVPSILSRTKDEHFDAIVIDPIYKLLPGDENNAADMSAFCNQIDRICFATGCSVLICHHHSKGAQGNKKAMDRASGSGVFARDPDAILDIIQLALKNDPDRGNATAWRMETTLREFAQTAPVNFWFDFPLHYVDDSDALKSAHCVGSPAGNLEKSSKRSTPKNRRKTLDDAYAACAKAEMPVKINDIAKAMNLTEKSARNYIKEASDVYLVRGGFVWLNQQSKS